MRGPGEAANRRVAVLFAVFVVVAFGPIVSRDSAQPASRYSLTAALAEHHTVDLTPYRHFVGVDHALYRGHLRSDKAPGQPILAVPVYLLGRALGAQPASHVHIGADLGLWWNTLWSATVPFAVLLALMFIGCTRFARRRVALVVAAVFGICTMMLPHAVNLYAHDLTALLGFGAWLVIQREISPRRAVLAGFLAGLAVLTEYEATIIVLGLAVYLFVLHRRRVAWYVLGGAAPLAALLVYQWDAFGAPWHTPAAYYAGVINGTSSGGYAIPGLHAVASVLFGNRGLLIGAPIAFVALGAAVWLAAKGSGLARTHAIVGLGIAVPYLVLCAGWSGLPLLEEPGPRYLIPALPFLAVPLAAMWDRLWQPAVLAAAWGAIIAVPAAFCGILLAINEPALPELPHRLLHGQFQQTVWSMAFGRLGAVFYAASVGAVAVVLARRILVHDEAGEQVFAKVAPTR